MLLFYVRHGAPLYQPDSLTPLGHEQAKALAKRLISYGIDEIYSSPRLRAQYTATPTAELLRKEIKILDWADEALASADFWVKTPEQSAWGFSHGGTIKKFNSPEVRAMGMEWYKHPYFEGTRFEEGTKRIDAAVDEFLLSLGYRHDREDSCYEAVEPNDKRVALFAHQGVGMNILSSILDIPYPIFSTRFDFGHSSMTVIQFNASSDGYSYPRVLQLSNDSHLWREGLMTGYNNGVKF